MLYLSGPSCTTNIAPENGWLEDNPFLLGKAFFVYPFFSGLLLLVSGSFFSYIYLLVLFKGFLGTAYPHINPNIWSNATSHKPLPGTPTHSHEAHVRLATSKGHRDTRYLVILGS